MSDTNPQDPTPPVPPAPAAYPPPAYGQPAQPASPAYGEPAAPAYGEPAAPTYGAPAAPAYGAPAYGQPAAPAYGAAPAYPAAQPYGGYGYPAAPKTNTLAIVSLVSAIAAWVIVPVIGSIVAVITGHMSLKQLKTNGEGGRGLALSGTIVGWVGIGFTVLIAAIFIPVIIYGITEGARYGYSG